MPSHDSDLNLILIPDADSPPMTLCDPATSTADGVSLSIFEISNRRC